MPMYTFCCLNPSCKECDTPFVRITSIHDRDEQYCKLCEAPVVRDGIEEIGAFWIDKAYRPSIKTTDGKTHKTPGTDAKGLRWH